MKLNCGLTIFEKKELLYKQAELHDGKWIKWFAWHQVRVGFKDCRWLEYVERRQSVPFVVHGIFGLKVMWVHTNYRSI